MQPYDEFSCFYYRNIQNMMLPLLFILMMSLQVSLFMDHEKIDIHDLWSADGDRSDLLYFESVPEHISNSFCDMDYMTKDL
jgi:ABC-type enterochelin transport system permease subunit